MMNVLEVEQNHGYLQKGNKIILEVEQSHSYLQNRNRLIQKLNRVMVIFGTEIDYSRKEFVLKKNILEGNCLFCFHEYDVKIVVVVK